MNQSKATLTHLLDEAEKGKPGALKAFFKALLGSTVYVPIASKPGENSTQYKHVVTTDNKGVNFLVVSEHGRETIPVFSDVKFVDSWAEGAEFSSVEKRFETLIKLLKNDQWIHINPGQEVGKELSPWEVEELLLGHDAIDEIVSELESESCAEIELDTGDPQFEDFKRKLSILMEVYPEIDEAFLVSFKQDELGNSIPVIGLKQVGLSNEQLRSINEEVQGMADDLFSRSREVTVVANLGDENSHIQAPFRNAVPFYIAQKSVVKSKGIVQRVISRLIRS